MGIPEWGSPFYGSGISETSARNIAKEEIDMYMKNAFGIKRVADKTISNQISEVSWEEVQKVIAEKFSKLGVGCFIMDSNFLAEQAINVFKKKNTINKLKVIKVKDVINSNISASSESGIKLYEEIEETLIFTKEITLDFSGVEIVTACFLNDAIGKFIGTKYKNLFLNYGATSIRYINIDDADIMTLIMVLENAKDFFEKQELIKIGLNK